MQELIPGVEHPDRKEYHLTDSGREALTHWLTTPLPPQQLRMAELIQVFFAGELSDAEVLALFTRWAEQARTALAAHEAVSVPDRAEAESAGMAREHFFWNLTFEYGYTAAQAELAWLESVIARMRDGQAPPATTNS
jgi:hypothetical protein